jgi:iron(III) transport system ATP-binding protein
MEPSLILLDEPLSNLDAELRLEMRREIRGLQQRLGITALYVTHDQEEAMAISDTVVVMNRGRIEQVGSPVDVFQRPATEFVARFMGCPNIVDVERAGDGTVRFLDESYPDAAAPSAARRVVIRSDAIALSDAGRHRAVVANAAFLGSRIQLTLRTERSVELVLDTAAVADRAVAAVGDTVHFDILPARLHYL